MKMESDSGTVRTTPVSTDSSISVLSDENTVYSDSIYDNEVSTDDDHVDSTYDDHVDSTYDD